MKFPIKLNSSEYQLAEAIAIDLVHEGLDEMVALPVAMRLMSTINDSHDDPLVGVEQIKNHRLWSDLWWVKYHPKTKHARAARKRLVLQKDN